MIRCNLAILLSERNLKISKVSEDTGISRTTLTALAYNSAKGIQFDTLNTLCTYLSITPSQLFPILPFEVKLKRPLFFDVRCFRYDTNPSDCFELKFIISENNLKKTVFSNCSINYHFDTVFNIVDSATITLVLPDFHYSGTKEEIEANNEILIKYFKKLPITFLNDIKEKICANVIDEIKKYNERELKLSFKFNSEEIKNIMDKNNICTKFYWFDELFN